MARSIRHVSLAIVLFAFWLMLSGHYTIMLIAIGILCTAGVVAMAEHMSLVDEEGHPVHLAAGALIYWPWLFIQIANSAWGVSKLILTPSLPISPTLMPVTPSQKTGLGVNIYANSITLTPGTISVEVSHEEILVHAITRDNADSLAEGAMDRRVTVFEGKG